MRHVPKLIELQVVYILADAKRHLGVEAHESHIIPGVDVQVESIDVEEGEVLVASINGLGWVCVQGVGVRDWIESPSV